MLYQSSIMFQRTACRRIKPYLHLFSPGARASEKGMLYRNGTMNAWARIASIPRIQQTSSESSQYTIACLSIFYPVMIGLTGTCIFALLLTWESQPFSSNMSKNRWNRGAYSEHDKFIRNSEMAEIIAMHAEEIANIRQQIDRPDVFTAPDGYISRSNLYTQ